LLLSQVQRSRTESRHRIRARAAAATGADDPASGFPDTFDNTGFTLTFCHDGRVHSLFLAQNTIKNDQAQQLLLVDQIPDDNKVIITIPKTIRNNIAAGTFASDITSFANNAEVQLSQISASGALTIASITGTQNDAATEYAGLFAAPTVRSDSNKGAFKFGLPTWMPGTANAWAGIPNSTRMSYTKNDGSGVLPAAWVYGAGQGAFYEQMDSFGGPTWSEKNKEVWFFGGGHSATNMNPLIKAVLATDTPSWVSVNGGSSLATVQSDWDASAPPNYAGGTFNTPWNNTGYYSDGKPKSSHGYRNNQYVDGIDEFLSVGLASCGSPTLGVLQRSDVVGFPRNGSAWRAAAYWPNLPSQGSGNEPADQCVCQASDGSGVFRIDTAGGLLWKLTGATKTWANVGGTFHNWMGQDFSRMGANTSGIILGIAIVGDPTTNAYSLRYINYVTGTEVSVTPSGAAFPTAAQGYRCVDVVWLDATGKWYLAFNSDPNTFSGTSGGYGVSWRLFSVQPTGSNTATVTEITTTGTAPSFGGTRRGLYASNDWKCLLAYDGYGQPLKALRVL
jgi:hypothetical protein